MFQPDRTVFDTSAPVGEARLAEILGAFSYALDLTEGQPAGHSVRAAWIGTHVGLGAGLRDAELADCLFAVLLKDLGCSSSAARVAQMFLGDDRTLKHGFKLTASRSRRCRKCPRRSPAEHRFCMGGINASGL